MNRESALAGGVVVVLAAVVVLVSMVPGVLANPAADEPRRQGDVRVSEVTIAPGETDAGTVTLSVDTRLTQFGPPAENVSLLLRAVDAESGLVARERTLSVGTLSGGGERSVIGDLTVAREGGYRIEVVVYRNTTRVDRERKVVSGVGALAPVGFHDFANDDYPVVEYTVRGEADNRTTLNVTTYLTNTDDDPAGDVRLVLKARQAESGIVADRTTVPVREVDPGATVTPSAELRVPSRYNYYLDAELWAGSVLLDTARSAANLDPSRSLSVNVTRRERLRIEDFTEEGDGRPTRTPQGTTVSGGGQPGFGAGVAAVALVVSALVLVRRRQQG